MPENQRRAPAKPKKIDEINPRDDIRARIVGTVISKGDNSVNIDDGTGTVEVFLDDENLENIEENQRIRILGRVLPTPDSFEIQSEIVQDFDEVDPNLYDKVKKVVNTSR